MPTVKRRTAGESVLAATLAGAVIGAVLAILAGTAMWPAAVGPLAYAAIVVVGSVGGSAMGVLAVSARKRRGPNR